MKLLIATSNPHKIDEIMAVVNEAGADLGLTSLKDAGVDVPEPVEDRDTFEGNALLKARYYAKASGKPCMADDSGLEVDAIGGAPGVISARYSGVTGGRDVVDPANNKKLLKALGDTPANQRTARFVCAVAVAWPNDLREPVQVRGTFEGRIITPDQAEDIHHAYAGCGTNGFGYDPLFWLEARGCTSAELSPADKNAISHRGDATRKLLAVLQSDNG
ncbi:MAG: non-canonical purine NTP pyrophosphatase [Phycisphaeraceae bacterium]|nr:non-canonical purine NTP pyrophosphatase [Phycisphaeraceae bacterium]